MWKKILLITSILFSHVIYADTCPSPAEIKANQLHGWQILDINDAEPLIDQALEDFKKNVVGFAAANWLPDAPEGGGECRYQGEDVDEVFLVKETLGPDKSIGNWHMVGSDMMQCDLGISKCRFLE